MKPAFADVKDEYRQRWNRATINPSRAHSAAIEALTIANNRERYEKVSQQTGVPWWAVGLVHALECGLDFNLHLHCGDPLTARTYHVPAGRIPAPAVPPFKWEDSAVDALRLDGLDKVKDWTLEQSCYQLETFNGWGYRSHGVPTAYLWAGTSEYTRGKFVSDGVWSPDAVSGQNGAMCILKELADIVVIAGISEGPPAPQLPPEIAPAANENPPPVLAPAAIPPPPPPIRPHDVARQSTSMSLIMWLKRLFGLSSVGAFGIISAGNIQSTKESADAFGQLIGDRSFDLLAWVGGGTLCACFALLFLEHFVLGAAIRHGLGLDGFDSELGSILVDLDRQHDGEQSVVQG